MKVLRQSGEVNGREVVIVDTPGWWKFFPAVFTPAALKSEILSAVSRCSPSPNVILLAVPLDTAFTEEQRRVTEDNMRLLGKRAWRHVIVLFTNGDVLVRKTIEQHIESEGKPLRWLIEKCEKRYHVLDNKSTDDGQVTALLERMEEMVAGNSCFYLSETNDPQPGREGGDGLAENKDENRVKEITEQLNIEWNRRNWEKYHIFKGDVSMDIRPTFNEDRQKSEASAGEKEEDEEAHEDDQFKTRLEVESDEDAGSGSLKIMKGLLEREWSRREASMEHFHELVADKEVSSEPDLDQLRKSRDKVLLWLETQHTTSGCKSEKENQRGKRRPALQPKNPAGSAAMRRKKCSNNY
uniref:AIG1-type G domain-containing protein n=1 Tax=Scophthalmus maximus TaxID=52904 RepID=A0A8D2ZVA5_SCOMX